MPVVSEGFCQDTVTVPPVAVGATFTAAGAIFGPVGAGGGELVVVVGGVVVGGAGLLVVCVGFGADVAVVVVGTAGPVVPVTTSGTLVGTAGALVGSTWPVVGGAPVCRSCVGAVVAVPEP
jgi:hypothetical protein